MISALKRLVNSNDNSATSSSTQPAPTNTNGTNASHAQQVNNSKTTASILNNGMHMISQSLQKKFSRGVNYNSKFRILKNKKSN